MRIECQTRELFEAVQLVVGVVSNNATRPILHSVLVKAADDGLSIQGTDLEVGLSVRVDEVDIQEAGEVAIPAARLHAILRELQGESVVLETTSDGQVSVAAESRGAGVGASRFKVPTESAEEFPELDFQPPSPEIRVSRALFLESLKMVSIAAAKDATRFQMHSVLLDCRDGQVRLVSTDGKRMAIGQRELTSNGSSAESQYIVPLKGVDLLSKILNVEESEEIELHLDQSVVTYSSDRVSLSCRLVEGRFPPYERAIPDRWEFVIDLPSDTLQIGLRQAALMTTKETNSVQFSFDGERLTLSTQSSNVGESRIELDVERPDDKSDAFKIAFNPQYMLDLIRAVDAPALRGHFKDGKTAGMFSVKEDETAYRHIVMPLVTND